MTSQEKRIGLTLALCLAIVFLFQSYTTRQRTKLAQEKAKLAEAEAVVQQAKQAALKLNLIPKQEHEVPAQDILTVLRDEPFKLLNGDYLRHAELPVYYVGADHSSLWFFYDARHVTRRPDYQKVNGGAHVYRHPQAPPTKICGIAQIGDYILHVFEANDDFCRYAIEVQSPELPSVSSPTGAKP